MSLGHVAFIMDGNRRWADERGQPRVSGHKEGILAIERVIRGCIDNGVENITLYAFSTENWSREPAEVRYLSRLLYRYLLIILKQSTAGDLYSRVSVRFIGEKSHFSERNERLMNEVEKRVLKTTDCHVNVAVSYGGQDEIVRAVNLAIENGHKRVSKSIISQYLYTAGIPDPDLVVRTSGVQRISNFLTWQSVYSEFIFYEKFWPEMTGDDIVTLLKEYHQRERRFGR